MPYQQQVLRDFGHPFTRESGWDLLEVNAGSTGELACYLEAAGRKYWKVWARSPGVHGAARAVLYKPAKAASEWDDELEATPVSRMLASVDMRATRCHLDLVITAFEHHIRVAESPAQLAQRLLQTADSYVNTGKAAADASVGSPDIRCRLVAFLRECCGPSPDGCWREHAREQLDLLQGDSLRKPAPLS